jgi:hypothetical protein
LLTAVIHLGEASNLQELNFDLVRVASGYDGERKERSILCDKFHHICYA